VEPALVADADQLEQRAERRGERGVAEELDGDLTVENEPADRPARDPVPRAKILQYLVKAASRGYLIIGRSRFSGAAALTGIVPRSPSVDAPVLDA
jgi:hypothetical protein